MPRIVLGKVLSDEELVDFEAAYLAYAKKVLHKVASEFVSSFAEKIVYEKMLSPFEHWLRDQVEFEAKEDKHGP